MISYGHYINGKWLDEGTLLTVENKYTNEPFASIYEANEEIVKEAVRSAKQAFEKDELSLVKRLEVVNRAAEIMKERKTELAEILIVEAGKSRKDALTEVERAVQTLIASAEEAKKLKGNGVSIPSDDQKIAFTIRVPVGVIGAITPFNFPLNLTVHKIGPALAAGNTVVLKPAELTPVIACKLVEIFEEAGLPKGHFNLINGRGHIIGDYLLTNPDVSMYTFTGSPKVGQHIKSKTGIRKVVLELGNNSPNIVHSDVEDLNRAAELCVTRGFSNAGQACISVQRVYVQESIYDEFVAKVRNHLSKIKLCSVDNFDGDIGPLITLKEAERIESWVNEAVENGAEVQGGGSRRGNFYEPTVLSNVKKDMKVVCEEIFGPVISLIKYEDFNQAIMEANDSNMGLQVGVFTSSISNIMKAAKNLQFGGVIINNVSTFRDDLMPYGGVKDSGTGKEGPGYSIKEMTEEKLIVLDN